MIQVHKMGAIDIGSNSVRCLVTNVIPTPEFTHYKKASMTRLPVRLGQDVFSVGFISEVTGERLVTALKAYKHIMEVHGVTHFRACATSAMREASNSSFWRDRIKEETGISVDIIDGQEEARLVFSAKMFDKITPAESHFLFVDVGGGSTELTLFKDGAPVDSISLPLGTVRMMAQGVSEEVWIAMDEWLDRKRAQVEGDIATIGSGGNINKIYKLSGRMGGEPLSLVYLERQAKYLAGFSPEEMMVQLGLNIDRADVIVSAMGIYIRAMKKVHSRWMYVPKIGVSDGIVRELYRNSVRPFYE